MPGSLVFQGADQYVIDCIKDIDTVNTNTFEERCATLRFLLSQQPQLIEARNEYQFTPLHYACAIEFRNGRQLEFIRCLIAHNADLNARGVYGLTPLHIAVCSWKAHSNVFEVICTLIKHGADPDAVTEHGSTLLHIAAHQLPSMVFHELVEFLVSIGRTKSFNAKDSDGWTVLHHTVSERHFQPRVETLEIFKAHGFDFNAITNKGISIALTAFSSGCSKNFLKILRQFGTDCEVWILDPEQKNFT
ncbi:Ankyrin repeat domain-containing protein 49 [Orchesella cincta]|uniref:Ankyrin repeat domain-containing protein 49 n=1 Tax=Orchesella cincta TaxID=48709 RepID=A0A1D2ND10_ORCCI|nr:Ankyrin repeat domain-containing protein 49 [Orchesella cincta]